MSSGKLFHHKIKFKHLNQQSKISELIDDIYKHHSIYLNHKNVSKAQIIQMVEKLREKSGQSAEGKKKKEEGKNAELENDSDMEYNIKNEDLNSLTIEEVKAKKKEMDKFFDKNNIKAGDQDFQYDVRKDFSNDGNAEWDDDF